MMFNTSETIKDGHSFYRLLLKSDTWPNKFCHRQWPCWTFKVIKAIFFSENKCSPLFSLWQKVQAIWHADDLEWPLKVISGAASGFVVCISKIQHTFRWWCATSMTSCASNYFYWRSRPEAERLLLYDAERDLLATAKFLIIPQLNSQLNLLKIIAARRLD